jgi:cytochrome oxidase Cu insertion factor (SCO1/SenC/PrrC family)
MTDTPRKSARVQLLLIALVFFGPLIVAAWMYYGGHFPVDDGRTNNGTLLEPIVNLADALPESAAIAENDGAWILLYANQASCDEECRLALYTLRQSRKMLGREMERVTRVFLHGETAPDTVFLAAEHEGLVTTEDASLNGLLENKRPAELPAGGYFLIDPLGNLVMYFRPGIDPADMVDDIKHLLRLSRIG